MTKLKDKAKVGYTLTTLLVLLSIVPVASVRLTCPWQVVLNTQLKSLNENYGGVPKDIIVVHLGINDRDEQAYRIAKSLSEALGHPVIALPSYSGNPKDDLRKAVVQYCNSRTYPVHFEKAWEQIVADGHRIIGTIVHSGAGLRVNTERQDLINFIKSHPGKISGNMVFVDTDLKGLTKKDLGAVGIKCNQIGKTTAVAWVTKPAARYIPFGEYLGPPATFLGWTVPWGKAVFGVPALVDAARGFPDHPLSRRIGQIKNSLDISTTPQVSDVEEKAISFKTGGIDFSSLRLQYLTEYQEASLYVLGAAFRDIPSQEGYDVD
ncbi:MAG: hypothetical protein E3J66_03475, partial [Dehalococcoidia bacterium]